MVEATDEELAATRARARARRSRRAKTAGVGTALAAIVIGGALRFAMPEPVADAFGNRLLILFVALGVLVGLFVSHRLEPKEKPLADEPSEG